MKPRYLSIFSLLIVLGCSQTIQAQYDDLYYDGTDFGYAFWEKKNKKKDSEKPKAYYEDEYVENYEYEHSSRIRRFHQPAQGFNYYSGYYVDRHWYDPRFSGTTIYMTNGYVSYVQYNNPWAFTDPYCSSYWNNPYQNYYYGNNGRQAYNNWGNFFSYNQYTASTPNAGSYVSARYSRSGDNHGFRSSNLHISGRRSSNYRIDGLTEDKIPTNTREHSVESTKDRNFTEVNTNTNSPEATREKARSTIFRNSTTANPQREQNPPSVFGTNNAYQPNRNRNTNTNSNKTQNYNSGRSNSTINSQPNRNSSNNSSRSINSGSRKVESKSTEKTTGRSGR